MRALLRRFLCDEAAQEVVEYAYAVLFVGLVGILIWSAVVQLIGARYTDYNNDVQDLWDYDAYYGTGGS